MSTDQEIMQSLVDMDLVTKIMKNNEPLITETASTLSLDRIAPKRVGSAVKFENVSFHYAPSKIAVPDSILKSITSSRNRIYDTPINETFVGEVKSAHDIVSSGHLDFKLHDINFSLQSGQHVAIVGPSGSGELK
jgi:ABC-type multidrug transport system fused ATPase/permease subunit